jgi:hypothetical protein
MKYFKNLKCIRGINSIINLVETTNGNSKYVNQKIKLGMTGAIKDFQCT